MVTYQTIDQLGDLTSKTALVRVDFNVPMQQGTVTDDFRLRSHLPTISQLFALGVTKIVLIAHLGRPDGEINLEFSLQPVAKQLATLIPDHEVIFCPSTCGKLVENSVSSAPSGSIILLENLRFDPREEANDPDFAADLISSTGADFFVQDGFGVVHRAHASTTGIPALLPSAIGPLLEHEISGLSTVINRPRAPLLVIIGGSKVADKQPLIDHFLPLADHIFVGGKIAADGYVPTDPKISVATDFVLDSASNKLDIGASSTVALLDLIKKSQTIVWNGVLGKVEDPLYAHSSTLVATALGSPFFNYITGCSKSQAEALSGDPAAKKTTVICGGDTSGFVQQLKSKNPELDYTLISTGGGAALEFFIDPALPGLTALIK